MCNNELANMVPIAQTTNLGNPFLFNATFISSSADGNLTSNGYSLVIVCKFKLPTNSNELLLFFIKII